MSAATIEDAVIAKLRVLPLVEQQEVLDFASFLSLKQRQPLLSLEELWSGDAVNLSDDDIDGLHRELSAKFPLDPE